MTADETWDRSATLMFSNTQGPKDTHLPFLYFVLIYVISLAVSSVPGMGLFRAFSYLIALFMPFFLAIRFSGKQGRGLGGMEYLLPLLLYYYGLLGSIAYNFGELNWALAIKMLIAPLFFFLGARIESLRPANVITTPKTWVIFGLIALLPVVVLIYQLVTGENVLARGADFSFFANRNNAALYAVALLGLFTVYARHTPTNVLVYMAVGASFGTLGVLIAIIFSLMLLVAKRGNLVRYTAGLVIAAAVMYGLAIHDVWIFARFKPVFGTLELLLDPRVHLPSMSYERLYYSLDTTDLSLAFRIKHWFDLMDIFVSAPVFNWIFGMGVGSSGRLSEALTVPHNDYLRILFECGIVTVVGFVSLVAVMLVKLGRRWEAVPFFTIALYMVSENLIDNFLAMATFYYAGGSLIYRLRIAGQTQEAEYPTSAGGGQDEWKGPQASLIAAPYRVR